MTGRTKLMEQRKMDTLAALKADEKVRDDARALVKSLRARLRYLTGEESEEEVWGNPEHFSSAAVAIAELIRQCVKVADGNFDEIVDEQENNQERKEQSEKRISKLENELHWYQRKG